MKTSVVGEIYPMLYRVVIEYSRNNKVSESEISGIVLFLAGRGYYVLKQTEKEQVDAFSMFIREFLEDYFYVRFLVPRLPRTALIHVAFSHTFFSAKMRSEHRLKISRNEGLVIMSFAVELGLVAFGYKAEKVVFRYNKEKFCRMATSYLTIKQCFPDEPLHKTILRAI